MNINHKKRAMSIVFALPCLFITVFSSLVFSAEPPLVKELKYYYFTEKGDKVEIKMATGSKAERVAVDKRGNIYVTDSDTQTVEVFNSNARHINQFRSVHVPVGIAVSGDKDDLTVYVGGYVNGNVVALLNQNGGVKGFLGLGAVRGAFTDISVNSNNDLYVMDQQSDNEVRLKKLNKDGAVIREFGPFVERKDSEVINGAAYSYTVHKMTSPAGIAFDESKGELYVSVREVVASLNNSGIGYLDANESYKYYRDVNGNPLGPDYKYWQPLFDRQRVIVIDLNSGALKDRVIDLSGGFAGTASMSSTSVPIFGIAIDNKGRLYVATYTGIKVYDVNNGALLSVNGGFASGMHKGLAFVPDASSGGLIYATSGNNILVYGIDDAVAPGNSVPAAPVLISPADHTYVASRTPVMEIYNSVDDNRDPLSYGYEIYEISNQGPVLVSNAFGVAEGSSGRTSMSVVSPLKENTPYRWRAQSFDGNAPAWSFDISKFGSADYETLAKEFPEFCVSLENHIPSVPEVIAPKNLAFVSSFSSSLSWNLSKDSDCYDRVEYAIEVSEDPGFTTILASHAGLVDASLRIDKVVGLRKGGLYYWRVRAIDNRGGESAFSSGSFSYRNSVARFASDQPDTSVYIDGNYGYFGRLLVTTPRTPGDTAVVEGLAPGRHFVTFVKNGYYDEKDERYKSFEPYHTVIMVPDPAVGDDTVVVSVSMVRASKITPSAAVLDLLQLADGMASPFVVDFNNDGFKDIIVGSWDGKAYLYLSEEQLQSDGTKKVVLTARGLIQGDGADMNVYSNAVPFVIDYDNDGKKDLLLGAGDGLIYLYVNIGQEEVPVFSARGSLKDVRGRDITVGRNAAPAVVDYNDDGKKDLVIGSNDGTLKVYLNSGEGEEEKNPLFDSTTAFGVTVDGGDMLSAGSNSKPFFIDWNGDGKIDLVVGRGMPDHGNSVNLFLNVGSNGNPEFVSIAGLKKWIRDKKRERGTKERISIMPYLDYHKDLGDLSDGSNAHPFVVDWSGSSTRDLIVGRGDGKVIQLNSR